MQKVLVAFLFIPILFLFSCSPTSQPSFSQKIKGHLIAQFNVIQETTEKDLLRLAASGPADSVKISFHNCRNAYKQIEWFTEYYAPTASREINGPPLPEIEIEETKVFPPSGLQVIEEYIYPPFEEENRSELLREIRAFQSTLKRTRVILEETEFTEAHVIDALKQEIYRIIILGISGFDTPLSQTAIPEAAISLKAVKDILSLLGDNPTLFNLFGQADKFLHQHSDFNNFDRMAFITDFANPITQQMTKWQEELKIKPLITSQALQTQAGSLFSVNAFNTNYFAGNLEAQATPDKTALGKALFFNPVISGGDRTCASCHKPEMAFTDGLAKSAALIKNKFVQRNAPTLMYAGLQHAQFYDMRSPSLENQALDVMANKDEMHASVEDATSRLNQQPAYVQQFRATFPSMEAEIRPRYVLIALASYIRSLTPFSSRFDKYMRGDTTQLQAPEIKGFNLFMGKAKCGTCHFMPLFNGTAGPTFTNTEAEVLGVPANPREKKPKIDPDQGRYFHNSIDELKYSFKTPTLRNIAHTAPYMHNGSFKTLAEVMDFYNEGGGIGLNINLNNQTLPADKLNLSVQEKEAIVAFLETLTDK